MGGGDRNSNSCDKLNGSCLGWKGEVKQKVPEMKKNVALMRRQQVNQFNWKPERLGRGEKAVIGFLTCVGCRVTHI